jgi:hypothetical protein
MQHPDEMTPGDLPAADREVEAALGGLAPAMPSQSRDQWLFHAGMESARSQFRRRVRTWQSLAAALALCTSVSMLSRPRVGSPSAPPRGVALQATSNSLSPVTDASATPPPDPYAALFLRDAVLARGMDALPAVAQGEAAPPTPIPSPRSETWQ